MHRKARNEEENRDKAVLPIDPTVKTGDLTVVFARILAGFVVHDHWLLIYLYNGITEQSGN